MSLGRSRQLPLVAFVDCSYERRVEDAPRSRNRVPLHQIGTPRRSSGPRTQGDLSGRTDAPQRPSRIRSGVGRLGLLLDPKDEAVDPTNPDPCSLRDPAIVRPRPPQRAFHVDAALRIEIGPDLSDQTDQTDLRGADLLA